MWYQGRPAYLSAFLRYASGITQGVSGTNSLPEYLLRDQVGQRVTQVVFFRQSGNTSSAVKLSVVSGIDYLVSNRVQPIRTVRFDNPTDRHAERLTGSQSLSK